MFSDLFLEVSGTSCLLALRSTLYTRRGFIYHRDQIRWASGVSFSQINPSLLVGLKRSLK